MKRSAAALILWVIIAIPFYVSQSGKESVLSAGNVDNHLLYLPIVQTPFVLNVTPYATGIAVPADVTDIVDPGDGRLFVAIKEGRILIVDTNGQIEQQLLLDIRDRVYSSRFELGLLGLAVHPNFETNGYIYVHFTRIIDEELYSEVARFHVGESGKADPQSEQNLLRIHEPSNVHKAGALQFGPNDGYLYIAIGDGGTALDEAGFSQSLQSLHGKILRINVDQGSPYTIPDDNPFANDPNARGEIWVSGLRNPWRFSFDHSTGDMYIGDVGDRKWEEINFVPDGSGGGQNFGWPCLEAQDVLSAETCDFSKNYTMPIFAYAHDQDIHHCSVIGGFVYRGTQLPELEGNYLFADLCASTIWALTPLGQSQWLSTRWTHFTQEWTTFGERSDGELFLGDISSDAIYQITRTGPAGMMALR